MIPTWTLSRMIYRFEKNGFIFLLLICARAWCYFFAIKSLNRQEECRRVTYAMRIETETVLLSLRGTSMWFRDGRTIVCAGASGTGLKRPKLVSFVKSVVA